MPRGKTGQANWHGRYDTAMTSTPDAAVLLSRLAPPLAFWTCPTTPRPWKRHTAAGLLIHAAKICQGQQSRRPRLRYHHAERRDAVNWRSA